MSISQNSFSMTPEAHGDVDIVLPSLGSLQFSLHPRPRLRLIPRPDVALSLSRPPPPYTHLPRLLPGGAVARPLPAPNRELTGDDGLTRPSANPPVVSWIPTVGYALALEERGGVHDCRRPRNHGFAVVNSRRHHNGYFERLLRMRLPFGRNPTDFRH